MPLPSKGQQDGCPKVDSRYCWGESKLKEMKRQELSPVYQQEFSSEGQVRQRMWSEDGERGWWDVDALVYASSP